MTIGSAIENEVYFVLVGPSNFIRDKFPILECITKQYVLSSNQTIK